MKPYFIEWGLICVVASSKSELASLVKKRKPDYIVLPQEFEGESGLLLAKTIAEQLPSVALLILGHAATPFTAALLASHGVSQQLDLPMAPSLVRAVLGRLLEKDHKKLVIEPSDELPQAESFEKLHVLVAEDNLVNQMVIKGLLAKLGVSPVIVDNGVAAVERFQSQEKDQQQSFDLILMDCEMPEMDGLTATREIRKLEVSEGYRHTPIIALTAHAMDEHKKNVLEAGMDCHLAKPVRADMLQAMLKKYG